MAVLLAVQDDEVRTALRLLLEEEGFTVIPACDARLALRVLTHSPEPLVAVLDAHLALDPERDPGESAAERILQLAALAGPWARHRFLVLATVALTRWSPRLATLAAMERVPVIEIPRDLDRLVPAIRQARAPVRTRAPLASHSA